MRQKAWMLLPLLAGCSTGGQGELYSAGPARSPEAPDHALVFAPAQDSGLAARNDALAGIRPGQTLYYGPGGRLYYADGTPVHFQGVKRQLQDLRSEERINPVR